MRSAGFLYLVLFAGAATALAQNAPPPRGWVYGYAGVGGNDQGSSFHIGGGGEILLAGGFGLGAEAARFGSTSTARRNISMLSGTVGYHFAGPNRSRKAVPYVSGGISLANGRSGGGNFGGGVQYWMTPHVALRFEFREYLFSSDSPWLSAFHAGIAIR